ncbi:MAG: hypothetical protein AAF205_07055 [Pseudomonadota bacterium]
MTPPHPARPWASLSGRERAGLMARRLLKLIPPFLVMVCFLLSTAPVFLPLPSWPNFGLILVFLFAVYRPGQLAAWVAVPLGLVADLMFGAPFGANAVLLPLFMITAIWVDRLALRVHWLSDWLVATPFILIYQLALWRLCLFAGPDLPFTPFLTEGLATLAAFPLVAAIFVRLQRRYVDGEEDAE